MHDPSIGECPHLPRVDRVIRAAEMRRFGKAERGADFYRAALETAQSLWLQGLPAQALLQINRAMGADLGGQEPVLKEFPIPYAGVAWVIANRREGQFVGNPRRHYQHLATRMVEPRKELRTWRAWACWGVACVMVPEMPADSVQIEREGIVEPEAEEIAEKLEQLGGRGESELWLGVLKALESR